MGPFGGLGRAPDQPGVPGAALEEGGVGVVAHRAGQPQVESEERAGLQPAVGHVVAVADQATCRPPFPTRRAESLDDGEQVGEELAGVGGVRESVHHRDVGEAGHLLGGGVGIGPQDDPST